jgi:leucyl-tRNA synthetase
MITQDGELAQKQGTPSEAFEKQLHKTIKKVGEDTEHMRFNTAIAAMMELVNAGMKEATIGPDAAKAMMILLSPYAPHMAEELWHRYGGKESMTYEPWPSYDPAKCVDDTVTLSIQVNGKMRGTIEVLKTADKAEVFAQAKALESVAKHMEGKDLLKEIYVPGKIINFVVKG